MPRPFYNIYRCKEKDDLFLDEEAEEEITAEDEAWLYQLRTEGRMRDEVE
jgi:hypothetical protein